MSRTACSGIARMLLALLGLAAAALASSAARSQAAAEPMPPPISGHFALESLDGRPVTDASYRGQWLVVFFGYTYCPDLCPTVLTRVGESLSRLGPWAGRVQAIFITVDPGRDTAKHLREYLAAFSPHIVGLRGDDAQLQAAARAFRAYYRARPLGNGDYAMDHSSFLYVIAPDGRVVKLLPDSLSADQLTAEMRTLASGHADGSQR